MRRIFTTMFVLFAVAFTGGAAPLSEVEITPDPVQDGQQTFDVRFTPAETRTYDKLTFVCVLHQEFPKATTDQRSGIQVHEPEVFTYRRRDVKMVEDLDLHIAFKVPVGIQRLKEIYGQTAFHTNYPVTVARMTISAETNGQAAWSFACEATGVHRPPELPDKEASTTVGTP